LPGSLPTLLAISAHGFLEAFEGRASLNPFRSKGEQFVPKTKAQTATGGRSQLRCAPSEFGTHQLIAIRPLRETCVNPG
jgi:hypothetical protein